MTHVEHVEATDGFHTYHLQLDGDHDVAESVFDATREHGWPMRELRRDDKTLDTVFRELTEKRTEVAA